MTPQDGEQRIARQLDTDERVLWIGVPRQGLVLRGSDFFMIPFSLMWGGFAMFWEAMVVVSNAPFFFMLWGIPFVAVGLYLIFGRFWVDSKQRARAVYAITSRRVLIISGLVSETVRSLPIRTLSDVSMTEKANGTGTITLGASAFPMAALYGGTYWPGMGRYLAPSLEMIPNVRDVYAQLRQAGLES